MSVFAEPTSSRKDTYPAVVLRVTTKSLMQAFRGKNDQPPPLRNQPIPRTRLSPTKAEFHGHEIQSWLSV
jgi:hypothetical protein